jgi:flagellar biogenesis protein FliO
MGYITNFIVYTLAMVGVMVVALMVFKNATTVNGGKSSKYLRILDSISLGQRKNLYIVSTGKEQFLIAGDVNNTCLISRLNGLGSAEEDTKPAVINFHNNSENISGKTFKETLSSLPKQNYMDKSVLGIKSSLLNEKSNNSVIKNIADILTK